MTPDRSPNLSRPRRRQLLAYATTLATAWTVPTLARAQAAYPSRPIRMVVPFTPGGSTDILGRAIGLKLTEAWGQPVVVENVPGAGGSIGADRVAKAAPDGYTLLMGHIGTLAVTPSLYPRLPYDPLKGFTAIAWVARVPNVLVVHPSVPARTVGELVAYARKNPGAVNYGSGGNGSAAHIATEYLKLQTGTQLQHVPYKGTAPLVQDLLGGQLLLSIESSLSSAAPNIKSGRLKGIAVITATRAALLPELPTVAEQGYPGFDVPIWFALLGPAKLPKEVVAALNKAVVEGLKTGEVAERFAQIGAEAAPTTPEQLADYMRAESTRWAKVVRDAKVTLD